MVAKRVHVKNPDQTLYYVLQGSAVCIYIYKSLIPNIFWLINQVGCGALNSPHDAKKLSKCIFLYI